MEDGTRFYRVQVRAEIWEGLVREGLISFPDYIMEDDKVEGERYPDDYKWAAAHKQIKDGYRARDDRAKELRE